MVLSIGYSSNICGPVSFGDFALSILFDIILEASFVCIPILVLEDASSMLLSVFELTGITVAILVDYLAHPIKLSIRKRSLILEHLLAPFKLGQCSPSFVFSVLELSTVVGAIFLKEVPGPIEFIFTKVTVITAAV